MQATSDVRPQGETSDALERLSFTWQCERFQRLTSIATGDEEIHSDIDPGALE
jgi:hypothetical protein